MELFSVEIRCSTVVLLLSIFRIAAMLLEEGILFEEPLSKLQTEG